MSREDVMNVLIVAGAAVEPGPLLAGGRTTGDLVEAADLVIGVDGGAELLRGVGCVPHLLVGDFDSISRDTRAWCEDRGVELHELPAAKDETDTEHALRIAVERGAAHVVVIGALGGPRLDHLLVNVSLLTADWLADVDVRLVDTRYELFLARGDVWLRGLPGGIVSLLPLTQSVAEVETSGLAYPLRRETLVMGASRGVSNVFVEREARVRHGKGLLLVVQDLAGGVT
jgi:thiamine pyrophosphokinase